MKRAGVALLFVSLLTHPVAAREVEAPAAQPITSQAPTSRPALDARAILVVRHGEVDSGNKTAGLTEAGFKRADDLAEALKDAGITRIFVSDQIRTQQTAAPLAKRLGLTPDAALSHDWTAKQVIDYVGAHSSKEDIVLIVFHHSHIPELLAALGDPEKETITNDVFDRLYLFLPSPTGGALRVVRGRYGAPTVGVGNNENAVPATKPAKDAAGAP
jgi:phosphohistidine phosphatase SixA